MKSIKRPLMTLLASAATLSIVACGSFEPLTKEAPATPVIAQEDDRLNEETNEVQNFSLFTSEYGTVDFFGTVSRVKDGIDIFYAEGGLVLKVVTVEEDGENRSYAFLKDGSQGNSRFEEVYSVGVVNGLYRGFSPLGLRLPDLTIATLLRSEDEILTYAAEFIAEHEGTHNLIQFLEDIN